MPTYFITGASRGLGLELARQLLASSPSVRVIAAVRNPATSTALQSLIKANEGRIEAIALDVTDASSIKVSPPTPVWILQMLTFLSYRRVSPKLPSRRSLKTGLTSSSTTPESSREAGELPLRRTLSPSLSSASTNALFSSRSITNLNENLLTNLNGPILVTIELLPLLRQGKGKQIFTTSSILGSLGGKSSQSPIAATCASLYLSVPSSPTDDS